MNVKMAVMVVVYQIHIASTQLDHINVNVMKVSLVIKRMDVIVNGKLFVQMELHAMRMLFVSNVKDLLPMFANAELVGLVMVKNVDWTVILMVGAILN